MFSLKPNSADSPVVSLRLIDHGQRSMKYVNDEMDKVYKDWLCSVYIDATVEAACRSVLKSVNDISYL